MKKNLLFVFLFLFPVCLCCAQRKIPCEPGDSSTFYNKTMDIYYRYTITRNDPYAMPGKGWDFKTEALCSRFSGISLGIYHFERPDLFREHRFGASAIIGGLDDTLDLAKAKIITTSKMMYSAEYQFTRFLSKKEVKNKYEVYEKIDCKYHRNKRINNQCMVKGLVQYGISGGVQGYAGVFHTVATPKVNVPEQSSSQVQKFDFPFQSLVFSTGVVRRYSDDLAFRIDDRKEANKQGSFVCEVYARALYAPLLRNNYTGGDLLVHDRFPDFKDHLGFALGVNFDNGGPMLASVETGIMPGLGYYIKFGGPLFNFALHRPKLNMNGTEYDRCCFRK